VQQEEKATMDDAAKRAETVRVMRGICGLAAMALAAIGMFAQNEPMCIVSVTAAILAAIKD
jgi:hypothetical protein